MSLISLGHLNTWSTVYGCVGKLGVMALFEKVCHLGEGSEVSKDSPPQVNSLSFLFVIPDFEFSTIASAACCYRWIFLSHPPIPNNHMETYYKL